MIRRFFLLFLAFLFILALGAGTFYLSYKRTVSEDDPSDKQQQNSDTQLTSTTKEQFSFAVIGDTEVDTDSDNNVFKSAIKDINKQKVPFVIHTGDLTAEGSRDQFRIFDKLLEDLIPSIYPTIGNNDIYTDKSGYNFELFYDNPYYSFDYEDRHFIILDNSSAYYGFEWKQQEWLKEDLILNDGKKLILVMHRPLNVPNADLVLEGGNELSDSNIQTFLKIIDPYKDKIEQIFTGHIHDFLQYKLGDIPVTVTGGGGGEPQFEFVKAEPHYLLVKVYTDKIKIEKKEIRL
ncbi:MAG: metallophosphoesterase [bacterium]